MQALVAITTRAFPERALCAELRFLLEAMLNALWEDPKMPYVATEGYDPRVVHYLQEAGIVETHDEDTPRMRLIAFHEPLPNARLVRPALYR